MLADHGRGGAAWLTPDRLHLTAIRARMTEVIGSLIAVSVTMTPVSVKSR
jgi:hypothetical protein